MKEEVTTPYLSMKELLDQIEGEDSIHIVDFHAEATGEKACFGYVLDGVVSAVLGTHTHVQTNDAKILPKGTAYISDVGMCGAANGVLGFDKNTVINKTIFGSEERFDLDTKDEEMINAVVMNIDDQTKKCVEIFSVKVIGDK